MSFLNPSMLFWLIPLAGILVALYLLKMKRRELRVPATFLWPAHTDEVRANALFQRLRFSWLLVLQLLALTLAVLALATPQLRQQGLTGSTTVLVIDTGASMEATDVSPSRFAEAVREVRDAIRSARPTDRLALIEAGPIPRVVFPLGSDPVKQERALDTVTTSDAEADVGAALRLASALAANQRGAQIVLLADGDFDPVSDFTMGQSNFVYKCIGDSDENLAINALGIAGTVHGRDLYCGVKSFSSHPFHATLSLYGDGALLDSLPFDIAAHGTYGHTMAVPAGVKVFEAKLDAPDRLKADNYAACVADPGASIRVLLLTHGDIFVERALALDPRVTLDKATSLPPNAATDYDVVVFDGVPEQAVSSRGILTLGRAGPSSPVTVKGTVKHPVFVSAEDVPLMHGVDLHGLFVDQAEEVSPKTQGQELAMSGKGPWVVASESLRQKQIYLAFDPLSSDFPLQVAFPIFIGNALDYLAGATTSDLMAVHAGTPFRVQTPGDAVLTDPDGLKTRLNPVGGSVVVREVRRVGVYRLQVGDKLKTVYSTLRNDRASDISPVRTLSLGGKAAHETKTPARFADFWRPLVLVCLLVLAGEWWLFARRS